jgi:hypothetical protein
VSFDPLSVFEQGGFPSLLVGSVYQAPADTQHGVVVNIPSRGLFGPMPWMPRGVTLPAQGDEAWVAFPTNGDPVCIAWWPFTGV